MKPMQMGSDELLAQYDEFRKEVFTRFPEQRWKEEAVAFNEDCTRRVYSAVGARAQELEGIIQEILPQVKVFGTKVCAPVLLKPSTWRMLATGAEFEVHEYGLQSLGKVWYSCQVHEITYFGSLGFKPTIDEIMSIYGLMGHTINDTLIQTNSGWLLDQERHLRNDTTFKEIVTQLGK